MTDNGNWITICDNTKKKNDNKLKWWQFNVVNNDWFAFSEEISNVLTALDCILVTSNLLGKISEINL